METVEFAQNSEQLTEKYDFQENGQVLPIEFKTQQTFLFMEKKSHQIEYKYPLINIDYIKNLKIMQYSNDNLKGAYSKIDIVKIDECPQLLVRKRVFDQQAFQDELSFFKNYKGEFIYDQLFFLEKGDFTIQSLFKQNNIQNQFFILLLSLSILEGVYNLQKENIYHGDIKPQNIILIKQKDFMTDKIIKDNPIEKKIVKQFFDVESDVAEFKICQSHLINRNKLNNFLKYSEIFKIKESQSKEQSQNKEKSKLKLMTFTNLLSQYFNISIKFIDFQSSVPLNQIESIKFFTNSFTHQSLLTKLKSNSRCLNMYEKMIFDQYSCFRTIILISQNLNIDQDFMNFNDMECIQKVDNYLLQNFLKQFYSVFNNINQKSNENQSMSILPTQKYVVKACKCNNIMGK